MNSTVSLLPYNTFRIDACAASLVQVTLLDDLLALQRSGILSQPETLVLGGGSNVLLTRDLPGHVVRIALQGKEAVPTTDGAVMVRLAAGESWHGSVLWSLGQGAYGLENLSLIPGSVGASPIQNIGAYGVELKDVFHSLEALDVQTGQVVLLHHADCRFGYRDSIFKREAKGRYIILGVTLKLSQQPNLVLGYGAIQEELAKAGVSSPTPTDVSQAVIRIRQSKLPDPAVIGNAGSFFKNPEVPEQQFAALKALHPQLPSYPGSAPGQVKLPAGWLIEQAGWKGQRFGNCGVHAQQALVLVNYGGASGKEIYDLSTRIVQDIQEKYGITLEREVNVV